MFEDTSTHLSFNAGVNYLGFNSSFAGHHSQVVLLSKPWSDEGVLFAKTVTMQPATAKWWDRRDTVFVEFCVEDSKDVKVIFDKSKFEFSCVSGADNVKQHNSVELFGEIDPKDSKHKRTDRSVLCCLRKAEAGKSWPRLTKDKTKCNWLSVNFSNWKDWEDESDEDLSSFDKFSEMMNNMGGDDLPDLDGAEEEHESADSDDEKLPDLEQMNMDATSVVNKAGYKLVEERHQT